MFSRVHSRTLGECGDIFSAKCIAVEFIHDTTKLSHREFPVFAVILFDDVSLSYTIAQIRFRCTPQIDVHDDQVGKWPTYSLRRFSIFDIYIRYRNAPLKNLFFY
jgi:hypothetical protein